jgi:hypothetical protein
VAEWKDAGTAAPFSRVLHLIATIVILHSRFTHRNAMAEELFIVCVAISKTDFFKNGVF